MTSQNTHDTGGFVPAMAILGEHRLITLLLFRAKMKLERVMGIEPNEHQIPRFLGKYSYHTDHSENSERPNSPNVLPMSQ
jgi:hypothetical protein